jgi:hypothetical protein
MLASHGDVFSVENGSTQLAAPPKADKAEPSMPDQFSTVEQTLDAHTFVANPDLLANTVTRASEQSIAASTRATALANQADSTLPHVQLPASAVDTAVEATAPAVAALASKTVSGLTRASTIKLERSRVDPFGQPRSVGSVRRAIPPLIRPDPVVRPSVIPPAAEEAMAADRAIAQDAVMAAASELAVPVATANVYRIAREGMHLTPAMMLKSQVASKLRATGPLGVSKLLHTFTVVPSLVQIDFGTLDLGSPDPVQATTTVKLVNIGHAACRIRETRQAATNGLIFSGHVRALSLRAAALFEGAAVDGFSIPGVSEPQINSTITSASIAASSVAAGVFVPREHSLVAAGLSVASTITVVCIPALVPLWPHTDALGRHVCRASVSVETATEIIAIPLEVAVTGPVHSSAVVAPELPAFLRE